MKRLCVLGITGSIGKNVSSIVLLNPNDFVIKGVCFQKNYQEFEQIYQLHTSIEYVAIENEQAYEIIKNKYPELKVFLSSQGILDLIDIGKYDMVVNALVGFAGLLPTVHTIEKGIDLALANKESLVVGGELIKKLLKKSSSHLYPIDSEHVALQKLINSHSREDIDSLIITCSGGSFRDKTRKELENVTVKEALNHPSWKMGAKITIDSATLVNKGFEIIEAYYLFDFPLDKIQVLLHDESIIHSLIKMKDNSLVADLGPADMRIPISYALYQGHYHEFSNSELSLEELGSIHFRKFDDKRFPAINLAKKALKEGGTLPCVLNASNEVCNLAFREEKIKFIEIEEIINKVMDLHQIRRNPTLKDYIEVNDWAKKETDRLIKRGD